ncbi:MAG: GTP 3',8-cyclase MoaA [Ruminococcus sp.]|nr:GTP 3',8-cyclase MoaA [Ruminococcus sp.]
MKDRYNREISYMRLSVTDLCNLKCKYCMPDGCINHTVPLSFEEMFDICKCAVDLGINKIRITGGEPLIREGIVEFCDKLSSIKNLKELTLTTNGVLLKDKADALKQAGVSRINISLDTLKRDKFRDITGFDKLTDVMYGIKVAEKLGFEQLKINVVLMNNYNIDEISDFVELTKNSSISVRFIELMPIGNCFNYNSQYISADVVLKKEPELKLIDFKGVAQIYQKNGYKGTIGLIRPLSDKFCDICNRIRITSDGKLKTCLHSSEEYDLRGLKGDDLRRKFIEAIINKPDSHTLTETCFSKTTRYMNEIGG